MLDGVLLSFIAAEIKPFEQIARVEKIYQPSKEELIISLRGKGVSGRLMLSAKGSSPRIHFTDFPPENPAVPPMFCMLLRKRLSGAKLIKVRQDGFERILFLDFECTNEMGDKIINTLAVEIMARHSNIILVSDDKTVVDSIRRVDAGMSSVRLILPGIKYTVPPGQDKLPLVSENIEEIAERVRDGGDRPLSKLIMGAVEGISPIIAREISYRTSGGDKTGSMLTENDYAKLKNCLADFVSEIANGGTPYLITDKDGKPFDFTFCNIRQYGGEASAQRLDSFSALLDGYYAKRELLDRMKQKSADLLKVISALYERTERKLAIQHEELAKCADRENYRICGELINANIYAIERGMTSCKVCNYYDDNKEITVTLDPRKTPSQNAQKYFKEYRKADTAEKMLAGLIEKGEKDLAYLDSIFDELSRATNERELAEIRRELYESGYIKTVSKGGRHKTPPLLPPRKFTTSDGFTVLVGRNNLQNDKLTVKQSEKSDLWFHTKDIPGSHTVLKTNGQTPSDRAIYEAACLAAYHSKAAESANVAVDYTEIKNVKKPSGAKPGFVIYTTNKTLYVTPDEKLANELAEKA